MAFEDLPREIRDQIYRECITGIPQPQKPSATSQEDGELALLRTSKSCYQKLRYILLSCTTLVFNAIKDLYDFLVSRSSSSLRLIRSIDVIFQQNDWVFDVMNLLTQCSCLIHVHFRTSLWDSVKLEHSAIDSLLEIRKMQKMTFEVRRYRIIKEVRTRLRRSMTRKKNVKAEEGRFDINRACKMHNKRLKIARERKRKSTLRSLKPRSRKAWFTVSLLLLRAIHSESADTLKQLNKALFAKQEDQPMMMREINIHHSQWGEIHRITSRGATELMNIMNQHHKAKVLNN